MAVNKQEVAKHGIGFGTALAIAISWPLNKPLFWAVLHGLPGWIYVIDGALALS